MSALVDWVVSDARDLSRVERDDRRLAIHQARDRMREGAVIFAAFLSRLGVLADLVKRAPSWIHRAEEVRALLEHGRRPDAAPRSRHLLYAGRKRGAEPEEAA